MKPTPTQNSFASFRSRRTEAVSPIHFSYKRRGRRSLPFALLALLGLIGQLVLPIVTATAQHTPERDEADLASAFVSSEQGDADFRPNELLVAFRPGTAGRRVEAARASIGAGRIKQLREIGVEHWRLPEGFGVERAVRVLSANPNVSYAEPNYIVSTSDYPALPNDTNRGELWGLHNLGQTGGTVNKDINAPEAWAVTTGSSDVVIGVIDSGIDYSHPDLQANIWANTAETPGNGIDDDSNGYVDDVRGWDFANNDNDPMDDNGHGTHVAGTIGAMGNNGIGVTGVNWNVRLMPLKFLGANGTGDIANAAAAVLYAAKFKQNGSNSVRITNNSWGGGRKSSTMQNAIANSGSLFVAAAGNGGSSQTAYPAGYNNANVLSVAATDHNDALATFSNFSSNWVDLAAPGVNIASTYKGGYGVLSGTSMASPHVAGVAGLVLAVMPGLSIAGLKAQILENVDLVPTLAGKTLTGGRLNAAKAVGSTAQPMDDCVNAQCSPAVVANFSVISTGPNEITLSWTPTGDDGADGTAYLVDIRVSTAPIIDELTFQTARLVFGDPAPQPGETSVNYTVKNLRPETHYYVAMRVADEVGNYSGIAFTDGTTTQGIWSVTTVEDGANNVGFYSSIAYDASGYPSIGFSDETAEDIKFTRWNGSNWETQKVDDTAKTGIDLAYDGSGNPAMTYGWGKLRFAQFVPSTNSWQITIVESKNAYNDVTSLKYDRDGNPSVAYNVSSGRGALKFARRTSAGWILQTVAAAGARYKSLAYDSQGYPSIAFSDDADGDGTLDTLKFARWNGSGWTVQMVETGVAGYGVMASLAYDDFGIPAIVHRAAGMVRFVRWNKDLNEWDPTEIVGNGSNCYLSFRSGKFYVSYSDQTAIWLGTRENGVWSNEGVDVGIQGRWIVPHAISSCGTPSLAYSTYPNYDLKFATKCE